MFETQHDFNYLDTDTLDTQCAVTDTAITIRDMQYESLIIDGPEYLDARMLEVLRPLNEAGRVVAYKEAIAGVKSHAADPTALTRTLDALVPRDVVVEPATSGLRFIHMSVGASEIYLFANEGRDAINVEVHVAAGPPCAWWEPMTGRRLGANAMDRLALPPLKTAVLVC